MLPQEFYLRLHHSRYFTHIMQYKNMQNRIKSTIRHRAVVVGDSVLIFFADGSPFISRQWISLQNCDVCDITRPIQKVYKYNGWLYLSLRPKF